jgi:hypothetical protein
MRPGTVIACVHDHSDTIGGRTCARGPQVPTCGDIVHFVNWSARRLSSGRMGYPTNGWTQLARQLERYRVRSPMRVPHRSLPAWAQRAWRSTAGRCHTPIPPRLGPAVCVRLAPGERGRSGRLRRPDLPLSDRERAPLLQAAYLPSQGTGAFDSSGVRKRAHSRTSRIGGDA